MKTTLEPPEVIDPNQTGPFHICLTCFTPKANDFTFCQTCGRIQGFFETPLEVWGEHCFVHNSIAASTYCVLCARPICKNCNEREGVSFVSGLPTPQCRSCLDRLRKLETDFRNFVNHTKTCAKHRDRPAVFNCVSCGLPHCPECSYFVIGGLFTTKLKAGPYCLPCFRTAHMGRTRRHWISGRRALIAGLICAGT